ncbi:MAG: hypothetical protein GY934_21285 [Gammaproteobacteria bacterium]|nr:hypothetical protein [Gammaproteobacteria bacterium]
MKEINLKITVDEANLILEGVGLLPFAKVYALVAKLQEQASQQLNSQDEAGKTTQPESAPVNIKEHTAHGQ